MPKIRKRRNKPKIPAIDRIREKASRGTAFTRLWEDDEKELQRKNRKSMKSRLSEIREGKSSHNEIYHFHPNQKPKNKRAARHAYNLDCYTGRNRILKDMGFENYAAYLKSGLWANIRQKVLIPDAQCVKCHGLANHVHHSKYTKAALSGYNLKHLHAICKDCHESAEYDKAGRKVSLETANSILLNIPCRAGKQPKKKKKRRRRRLVANRSTRIAPSHWRISR